MAIDDKLEHSFKEMESKVIDAALFGRKDELRATVSWIDLYKSRLQRTKEGAVEFAERYLVPPYVRLVEAATVLESREMKHNYDNAWRLVFRKYAPDLAYYGGLK